MLPRTRSKDSSSSFDEIDPSDLIENNTSTFQRFPWLKPDHPLYFPGSNFSDARWASINKFSIENWYPFLQQYTFSSEFITLDADDIEVLLSGDLSAVDSSNLENKISTRLNKNQVFMRLSSRSPKDSAALYEQALTTMIADPDYWHDMDNEPQRLVSFVASMTKAMKCNDASSIIKTIMKSPRISNDLRLLLSTSDPAQRTTKIILREWYAIRPDHEFRLFVSRRCRKTSIVTAISQYFHFLYFDKLPIDCFNFQSEPIQQELISKFQDYILTLVDPAVAEFLNFSSEQDEDESNQCIREYIVDLALVPYDQGHSTDTEQYTININGATYRMVVVELNPFAPAASGGFLFDWNTELNLLWGRMDCDYPIFRYRTEPRQSYDSVTLLPPNYQNVLQKALEARRALNRSDTLQHKQPQLNYSRQYPGQLFSPNHDDNSQSNDIEQSDLSAVL